MYGVNTVFLIGNSPNIRCMCTRFWPALNKCMCLRLFLVRKYLQCVRMAGAVVEELIKTFGQGRSRDLTPTPELPIFDFAPHTQPRYKVRVKWANKEQRIWRTWFMNCYVSPLFCAGCECLWNEQTKNKWYDECDLWLAMSCPSFVNACEVSKQRTNKMTNEVYELLCLTLVLCRPWMHVKWTNKEQMIWRKWFMNYYVLPLFCAGCECVWNEQTQNKRYDECDLWIAMSCPWFVQAVNACEMNKQRTNNMTSVIYELLCLTLGLCRLWMLVKWTNKEQMIWRMWFMNCYVSPLVCAGCECLWNEQTKNKWYGDCDLCNLA